MSPFSRFLIVFAIGSTVLCVQELRYCAHFQLTLEMSSTVPSVAQLFYDTGSGYSEHNSRTAFVSGAGPDAFQKLTFELPCATITSLRFDPLTMAGRVMLRNVVIGGPGNFALSIPDSRIVSYNQILSRKDHGKAVEFMTVPGANDPGLLLTLTAPFRAKHQAAIEQSKATFAGLVAWFGIVIFGYWTWLRIGSTGRLWWRRIQAWLHLIAKQLSFDNFIQFDVAAIWFYLFCAACFVLAVCADLNGSSIGVYRDYGYGAANASWLGTPQPNRSDEWVYHTPDILNEALRPNRFAVNPSPLGNHSIALTGNLPLAHFSTAFRPQFWGFFVLPVEYAYSAYWQWKALLLVTGIFTLLLLLTGSTFWSVTGALWYLFSPCTQWTYSWPSLLTDSVGLLCFSIVFACYLVVGRNRIALALAAIALTSCSVNFALCAYLPHVVPLFWLAIILFVFWCLNERDIIFAPEGAIPRAVALSCTILAIGVTGALIFVQLQSAIVAVLHTSYPGQRVSGGGSLPPATLLSHFFAWTEWDLHVPTALSNIGEAAGFLWLAPATLFCPSKSGFTSRRKAALIALWIFFSLLLAWAVLPLPVFFGKITGLDRTAGVRMVPALGLANIAIVVLTLAASEEHDSARRWPQLRWLVLKIILSAVGVSCALLYTNKAYGGYFNSSELVIAIGSATLLIVLILERAKLFLALALILPQALLFGTINPVERGLQLITSSDLFKFVRQHPDLQRGRWLVYSDSPVPSGFFAAIGCSTYTGLRYMPDIDHFPLLAARGLDLKMFNRDGYLTARSEEPGEKPWSELITVGSVRLRISPTDPLLPQLGIKYVAFDGPPSEAIRAHLIPLSSRPVDKFWLYRFR